MKDVKDTKEKILFVTCPVSTYAYISVDGDDVIFASMRTLNILSHFLRASEKKILPSQFICIHLNLQIFSINS